MGDLVELSRRRPDPRSADFFPDDQDPIVVLPGWTGPGCRVAEGIAAEWAAENPEVAGYIVVAGEPERWPECGGYYYVVQNGEADMVPAIWVRPFSFIRRRNEVSALIIEENQRLRRAVRAYRKQLKDAGIKPNPNPPKREKRG